MKILEAYNLKKTYQLNQHLITPVKNISLSIASGEVLAFLGPNGAGKTTSIKMMAGLIKPDSGWTKIAGIDPHLNPAALKNLGTVLEGNRNVYWRLTPQENLIYFGVLKGLDRSQARKSSKVLLKRFQLEQKRHSPVQQLSRGMQQKLAFAIALINKPKLLLLDEPTLGLDVEATENMKVLIREIAASGCAILLTTHQLDIAEKIADRIAIIQGGKISIELPTSELIKKFSSSIYKIEIETELDKLRFEKIEQMKVKIENKKIIYVEDLHLLYLILELLKPLPLKLVQKTRSDLTQIFLNLVKEQRNLTNFRW